MSVSLYELSRRINSSMPLGTIIAYYGNDQPSGWMICDGRSCAGTELATKLGIKNVPDLRGRFIRMVGGNAAEIAVAQEDCIRNITGRTTATTSWTTRDTTTGAFSMVNMGSITSTGGQYSQTLYASVLDTSRVVPTGPENRPINMAFNYIIRVNTNVILYYVSNIIYKGNAHILFYASYFINWRCQIK